MQLHENALKNIYKKEESDAKEELLFLREKDFVLGIEFLSTGSFIVSGFIEIFDPKNTKNSIKSKFIFRDRKFITDIILDKERYERIVEAVKKILTKDGVEILLQFLESLEKEKKKKKDSIRVMLVEEIEGREEKEIIKISKRDLKKGLLRYPFSFYVRRRLFVFEMRECEGCGQKRFVMKIKRRNGKIDLLCRKCYFENKKN